MVKKKSTTRTCSKCKTTFPVGQSHNVRTCGKVEKSFSLTIGKPRSVSAVPQQVDLLTTGTVERNGSKMEYLEFGENKSGRLVAYVEITMSRILVKIEHGSLPEYVNENILKGGELSGYTHVSDGKTTAWFNEKGFRHRLNGPAVERSEGSKYWFVENRLHRLDGPAVEWGSGGGEWWVNGTPTGYSHLCEKAVLLNLTRERFYELCTHKDYVVRQVALHNPNCPQEFKLLTKILYGEPNLS